MHPVRLPRFGHMLFIFSLYWRGGGGFCAAAYPVIDRHVLRHMARSFDGVA
jgi:hypothetical protein